ncbi:tenascin-X [Heteronotia binoei]|uniref:tenascin-X n=1 Tax=Heteronotia binoei TaxID=13085 RepID=UPI00292D0AD3|nr:tenascin-X [Heteronotia binoei]
MGSTPKAVLFQLLILSLTVSWGACVPQPAIPPNATIFSHIYTIKLAGDSSTEGEEEGTSHALQEARGPPGSSRGGGLYEHTLEGPDQEHVVFTHRINLPPPACGCPPGTEDTQELLRRLEALENEVRELRETCQAGGSCCSAPASIQASTGQTDTRTLCSHHGSFDLSRCLCECEPGWGGPTCAQPACPGGCGGPQRGKCVDGRCQCRPGYSGVQCEEPPSCPDDCNDQGRCVDGRCSCFPGYVGPSCADSACPQDCQGHGQCVSGRCVCEPGYSGPDCGTRACPSNCNRRGECHDGRCVCEPGFTGPACGTKSCPNDCNQRGRCLKGGVCSCHKGYTGSDCGQLACPEDCSGHGECQQGVCQCHDGYSGDDCSIEIPSIGVRVSSRDETSFRLEWSRPETSVDGYEIHVAPVQNHQGGESVRLSSTETTFERKGLEPGKEYTVTIRAEKGQRYGPPVSQTVRTRVAPPRGLRPSGATEDTLTLHWDPPTTRPDSYILSYMPVAAARPSQPPRRLELPAEPESITLEDLEIRTRYRITLIARQAGESSRPTSVTASTTVPVPSRVIHMYATPSPSSQLYPGTVSSGREAGKPGHKPHPSHPLSSTTSLSNEFSLNMIVQNISATLSSFNGTLLERLESYVRTTKYPLRSNQTIEGVARAIYTYLIHRKPVGFQEMIYERLGEGTDAPTLTNGLQGQSVFSNGYTRTEHTKPAVVVSSPDSLEVSLDGVTKLSDEVFIHYHKEGSRERGELVVPGGTPTAVITGLTPGTTYYVEIHGVVKGRSSKSYSFVTRTAPGPSATKVQSTLGPITTLEVPVGSLNVTDVFPNSLRVVWSAPPSTFRTFSLQYRDPKSSATPGEIRVPGSERSVNVMGLNPSTEYDLELRGETPDGVRSAPITTKASTAPAAVPPEREKPNLGTLSVSEVTGNSARLLWDSPTGTFDSFLIQYKDAEGKPKALPVDANSREATITDLVPSRKYKFNLYGFIGRKRLGPVSTEAVTAPGVSEPKTELMAAPSLGELIASEIAKDSVRLSWSVPSGSFDSFVVQFKDAEGRAQALPVEGAFRTVTVTGLAPSRRYRFNLYGITNRKRLGPVTKDVTTASQEEEPLTVPEPVLGDLLVSDTTSNSVRLLWSVPAGSFDSFMIQYQDPEGNSQALPVGRDSLEVTVPNLVPSQRYRFNLYGISGPQRLGPVSTDATTAPSQETKEERPEEARVVQPILGELSASNPTSNSIHLSWTTRSGKFDSFQVQFKDAEGKPRALPMEGDSHEVTIPNLSPSHRYKFNLYGVSGRKRYGPVSTEALTAPDTVSPEERVPVQPSLGQLSVSDTTSDSVLLSWTVPTGSFDSFLIQFKDAEGKSQALPMEGVFREATVPDLAPSRRYKFNLYGFSGRKRFGPISTDATTAATATSPEVTTERVPVQPSLEQLAASDITSDSLRLSWIVRTGNFDSFLVQYKDAEGKSQSLPVEGTFRTLVIQNLEPSRRYKFHLYGLSGNKRFGPLSVDAVTAPPEETVSLQPSLGELSASDITTDSLRLSWGVSTGSFDSFLILYKDAEGRPQSLPVDGGSREVILSNLGPSYRYKFSLYGVSGRKRVGPVSIDVVTASQMVKPTPPLRLGELLANNITPSSLDLSWNVEAGNFDSFIIQYRDAKDQPQALSVDGVLRSFYVHDLAPSHRYKFNLYGISGRKRLGPVSTEAVTAPLPTAPPAQPSLGEFLVSDVTSDSVRLSWTVPTGSFDSFTVQYKDADGRPQSLPMDGGSYEVTVSSLAPSRRYKFNLYGVSGRNRVGPISTDVVTDTERYKFNPYGVSGLKRVSPVSADAITAPLPTAPPAQPSLQELSVSDVTSNSVRLSWTVATGTFDSFVIQHKDADGRPQTLPVDGGSHEVTISSLAPSRRYKFNLYGVSGRKRVGPVSADVVTAPLPTAPPAQPSLGELSVSDVTIDSVRLSWTVPTGSFDSFTIQYKDADGRPQMLPVEGVFREVTIPSLAPSRRYKFNLYGLSGRKRFGPISADSITAPLPTAPPGQPSLEEFRVSDVTSDSVRLFWTVPTGSFDSFLIQYKDTDKQPQTLPVDGGSREVTVPSLAPSHRYKFNLYGVSGHKRVGPVSADAVTAPSPTTPPPQPSLGELSVSDVTTNSARLSWTVPTGSFDSFLVQYKDADGKTQALPLEGNSHETTVSNLLPSRRYKFNLYGVSGQKRLGPLSADVVTASPPQEPPIPPSLGKLSASDITSNSLRLSWSVLTEGFESFVIQYKDAEGKPQALPVEGAIRDVTVPNLVPSRRYKFNLYGLVGRKRLGPISTDAITGQEDAVKPSLGELSVFDVTSDSSRLSWTVPTGSFDSFQIQYKDADGKPQALPVEGGSREVTITNLAPSRRYKFNLYGVSGRKRLGPISAEATTAAANQEEDKTEDEDEDEEEEAGRRQPRLGELSVSEATSDSVHLSWSVPTGNFDSFLVQYRDAENNLRDVPVEGDSLEATVPNLTPSHRYRFELYGIFGQERLGPITVDASTAPLASKQEVGDGTATPQPQPELGEFSVSDITSSSVRLFWNVPFGIFDSFLVQYKDTEGKPQSLPVGKEINYVVIYYLVPSYRYTFNLYGISGRKRFGPLSATVVTAKSQEETEVNQKGGTEEVTPGTELRLGNLSVTEVTSNTARLSWTVPSGSFDSFSVQYKDAEGRPQAIPVTGGSLEVIVPNLAPSRKYRFNLYGISGRQRLGPISVSTVTAATTPEQEVDEEPAQTTGQSIRSSLRDVTVSEVTPDSLLLSWSVQEGSFDSFLIQYKDATRKLQVLPVDGAMRSLHLYNLTPSQRYEFSIYGISGHERLGPVSVDTVTAPEISRGEADVQPRLEDLSVSSVTSDSISLSWTVPAGKFDSILVQYRDAKGKAQVVPLNGNSRNITVPDLVSSRRYKFNLYGIYGHKRLGPLSIDAVTDSGTQSEEAVQLRLGELSASDITPESVLLSWIVQDGNFDSFIIQYNDAEGKPHALPVDGGLRSLRLHDMTPSHRYRFNLYGVSGRKRLGPISTEAVTAPAAAGQLAPPRLGEISASDATGTSVRLSWSVASGNFDSFTIQYRDAEGKAQTLRVDGSSRNVTVSNLAPSRRYKFNLYGLAGRKRLGPISTEAITARMEEPEKRPKLGDLSISEVTKDSVRLSWTIAFGKFDSFLIQYKDAEERPQSLPTDAGSRTFVVSGLLPSQKYNFNLYGISGRKQIGPISIDAVTAFPEAISKPVTLLRNLVVSDVTPTTLQLAWEVPEGQCDSFRIRYKDSLVGSGKSPPPPKEVEVPGVERSTVLRDLAPNKEYSLTLYGIKNGLEVASINTAARTSGLELDSPRDLRFSDIRETSVMTNWRAPSSRIDRYKISFQPLDGGEPRSISVDGSTVKTIIKGLTPGTSYEVSVMSIRGFEESEPLVGYVTTVPDGPSDLRAVNVTDSSAVLIWQPAVAEMNNYIVTYGPAGGSRVSESVPGNRAELRLSGLQLDTEYRASVYGEKEGNRSSPVSATFTTGADGPRNLQASEISARSARLTWLPPRAPPGGYLLSYETPYGETKEITVDASVTSYELQDLFPSSRYQVQVQAMRRGTPTAPISTSFTTGHLTYPFPRDCAEESWNGLRPSRETTIYLGGDRNRAIQAYCDMETDGGGWLVFQRRMNGKTDFWRDWQDYATGFGNRSQEFWLGNDALHQLTTSGDYEVRVDLRSENESVYALYDSFRVDSPTNYYRLHLGSYSGTAGDAFSYHSGSVFSTRDRDPNRVIIPCAVSYRGAWWYHNCHYANLNGLYANNRDHQGINWFNWKGFEYSIPFTEMKLRPRGFRPLRRV